jgi:hypothetical protein
MVTQLVNKFRDVIDATDSAYRVHSSPPVNLNLTYLSRLSQRANILSDININWKKKRKKRTRLLSSQCECDVRPK